MRVSKKAFTLFELLVVVSLIGIVYSVFNQKLTISAKNEHVSLDGVHHYAKNQTYQEVASLVCLVEEIEEGCRFYLDHALQTQKFAFFKKFDTIEVYKMAPDGVFEVIEPESIVEDDVEERVLWRFDIFTNGGFEDFVLRRNDSYYLYNSYDETRVFDGITEVENYLFDEKKILQESI
mgnify:CR=1 FL=1